MNKIEKLKEQIESLSELLDLIDDLENDLQMETIFRSNWVKLYSEHKVKEADLKIQLCRDKIKSAYRTFQGQCELIKQTSAL